jgi:hypothetical protein
MLGYQLQEVSLAGLPLESLCEEPTVWEDLDTSANKSNVGIRILS